MSVSARTANQARRAGPTPGSGSGSRRSWRAWPASVTAAALSGTGLAMAVTLDTRLGDVARSGAAMAGLERDALIGLLLMLFVAASATATRLWRRGLKGMIRETLQRNGHGR